MGLTRNNADLTSTQLETLQKAVGVHGATRSPQMFGKVQAGVDSRDLILTALAELVAVGGGTLLLPYLGGAGYSLSDTITVSSSNIHIVLLDDVALSKTTKASAFIFSGSSRTQRISNVSIVAAGTTHKVDANGRNVTGYTYSTADTFYSAVLFRWCDDWRAERIYGYNGLVNCLRAFQCGKGSFVDCSSSHPVYDNGQSIDFDPTSTWSDTDPSTWSNAAIIRPRAWACYRGFGVTAYSATGVNIEDPVVWDCGNDDPLQQVAGGGISIEGDYFSPGSDQRDRRCRVVRPTVSNCWNAGLFNTAKGTQVEQPNITKTKAAIARTSAADELGSNVYVAGSGTLSVVKAINSGAGGHGVCSLGTSFSFTATTTSGSTDLVVTANPTGKVPGGVLVGAGIPGRSSVNGGTKIISGPAGGALGNYTMSSPATASGSVTVAATFVPSIEWDGVVDTPAKHGFYGRGYEKFIVSPASTVDYAGGLAGYFNSAGGDAYLQQNNFLSFSLARAFRCQDRALRCEYGGRAVIDIALIDSCRLGVAQNSQVQMENTIDAIVRRVRNRDPNTKTAPIVNIASTCTNGQAENISGDKAGASARIVNSAINILTAESG